MDCHMTELFHKNLNSHLYTHTQNYSQSVGENRIVFNLEREENSTHITTQINSENIKLSEMSQSKGQDLCYSIYMINSQICRDREENDS